MESEYNQMTLERRTDSRLYLVRMKLKNTENIEHEGSVPF